MLALQRHTHWITPMVGHHDVAATEIVFVPQSLNPVLVERPYPTSGIPPAPFSVIQVPQSFLNDFLMPLMFFSVGEAGSVPAIDDPGVGMPGRQFVGIPVNPSNASL